MQVRVTESGFNKLTAILPGMINNALDDGFCIGKNKIVDAGVAEAEICGRNDGVCTPGCQVDVMVDSINMSIPNDTTFNVRIQFDVDTDVRVDYEIFWVVSGSCNADVTLQDGVVDIDIKFGIDPGTGELRINLDRIRALNIDGLNVSGCGAIGAIVNAAIDLFKSLLNSFLGDFLLDLVAPLVDGFLQDLLPSPLGLEGLLDVGNLLSSLSPNTDGAVELKAVLGGYVSLPQRGLSVGVITGVNSDRDVTSRNPDVRDLANSEPALCVPQRPSPDFALPPKMLPKTSRNTFALLPADEFIGMPDPAGADIAFGVSETFLDHIGFHMVSSGGLCLGVGQSLSDQLNLGTIGIIVPSLSELGAGEGNEPILLVLRPKKPIDFTVGDGTAASPHVTLGLHDIDIDFYAWLYERYVRGFTVTLDMDLGLNLGFGMDPMTGEPVVIPELVGLESDEIGVKVINAEFLREDPAQLEALFPTLLDLVIPLLGDSLGEFALPEIEGFRLENLSVEKVVTGQPETFLALYAGLAPAPGMMPLLVDSAPFNETARQMLAMRAQSAAPVDTIARVVRVTTPSPEEIRRALRGQGGALPEVELELSGVARPGQTLEWQWRLDGGMWRTYTSDAHPVLRDRAFALQGRRTLEIRARADGDYRTLDLTPVKLEVVFDSIAPSVKPERFQVADGVMRVWARDMVTPAERLEYSFGDPESGKATDFEANGGALSVTRALELADARGTLRVRVRDESGNVASALADTTILGFHGRPQDDGGGCSCHVSGRAHTHGEGGLALALLGVLGILALGGRRRLVALWRGARKAAPWLGVVVLAGLAPGCSCGGKPADAPACEVNEDCAALCEPDQVPLCLENECLCADDIPFGDIGMHSDIGVGPDGRSWVSAYNRTHGDLMVALVKGPGRIDKDDFEFVDGVPEGPVVLPGSKVRGGIEDAGEDVGLYTSLAVTPANEPVVAYYDRTNGSLKVAGRYGGDWIAHTVDKGAPGADPELGSSDVGRYASLTIDKNGFYGIAYHATVYEAGTGRTEVRYARAKVTQPASAQDWDVFVVDQAAIPDVDPPPTDLPESVGLFTAAARRPDGSPVIVYYDRINGDLKAALWDAGAAAFGAPIVVDGADGSDQGFYPSVAVDSQDTVHISYVDAGRDDLRYVNLTDNVVEVVDDGLRIDGVTDDGYDIPVFHFIGDDSNMIINGAFLAIVYQDATTHELLMAQRDGNGGWTRSPIAGDEAPFQGAYGFYASAEVSAQDIVISTYVVDQPNFDSWVEVFSANVIVE